MPEVLFKLLSFNKLSNFQLYDLLKLRNEIFVVEQNCIYLDTDDKDQDSHHILGYYNNSLVAYARIIETTKNSDYISIGRVAVSKKFRSKNFGKLLMQNAINNCFEIFKAKKIKISAQEYLYKFYSDLGFLKVSDTYLEDGIPHIEMILEKRNTNL